MTDTNEFIKEVLKKWELWEERKKVDEFYFLNGESLNQVMYRLNCNYNHICNLFNLFGLERRPGDYDLTLKIG